MQSPVTRTTSLSWDILGPRPLHPFHPSSPPPGSSTGHLDYRTGLCAFPGSALREAGSLVAIANYDSRTVFSVVRGLPVARMTLFGAKSQANIPGRIAANWITATTFSASLWEQMATRRNAAEQFVCNNRVPVHGASLGRIEWPLRVDNHMVANATRKSPRQWSPLLCRRRLLVSANGSPADHQDAIVRGCG